MSMSFLLGSNDDEEVVVFRPEIVVSPLIDH
jgi:hypothetical protein